MMAVMPVIPVIPVVVVVVAVVRVVIALVIALITAAVRVIAAIPVIAAAIVVPDADARSARSDVHADVTARLRRSGESDSGESGCAERDRNQTLHATTSY